MCSVLFLPVNSVFKCFRSSHAYHRSVCSVLVLHVTIAKVTSSWHKDYCGVITLCQDKVVLSHFNSCFVTFQHRQKKEGKSHHLALALALTLTLTLTVTPHPDHSATRHCWRLQCTVLSLMHQHYQTYCNEQYVYDVERYIYDIERYVYVKNNSTIIIMSWWCNWGNGDMENHLLF